MSARPLSELLDRLDAAFYGHGAAGEKPRGPRSPPSAALLDRLRAASSSVDSLVDLLDEWHALLEGNKAGRPPLPGGGVNVDAAGNPLPVSVDRESRFGVYLRRLCLGMEEIPFESLGRLWEAVRGYRDRVEDEDGPAGSRGEGWRPSGPQVERAARRACLLGPEDPAPGTDPAPDAGKAARPGGTDKEDGPDLLKTNPECPSVHFLLFLRALSSRDGTGCIDGLHRYFDYAAIHERRERAGRALMLAAGGEAAPATGPRGPGPQGQGGGGNITSGMGGIVTTMLTGGLTGGLVGGGAGQGGGQQGQRGGQGNNNAGAKAYKESNVMQVSYSYGDL